MTREFKANAKFQAIAKKGLKKSQRNSENGDC